MLKLLKYIRGSALLFAILGPLMMFLEVFMDLLQPTLMSRIIDYGVANGNVTYVLKTGGLMLICSLIGVIGGILCSIFATIAGTKTAQVLRGELFTKVQTFSFEELDHFKTSSLITRLTNDVTQVQNIIIMGLRAMVRSPLMCIGGLIMAVSLSRQLSIVLLVALPLIIIIVFYVMNKSFHLYGIMQEKIDNINTVLRENLLGIRVVKAFTLEEKQMEHFHTANHDLMTRSMKAQNITILLMPIVTLIVNLSVVAILWYGGKLSIIGGIETGKIIAFINYLTQIMMSLLMLVMMAVNISRGKVSWDRINEVLETEPSIHESKKADRPSDFTVVFDSVSFQYNKGTEYALKDISFRAKAGEKIGIIGGTGSGKSTLVNLIPRLYDVSEGHVLIGDMDVRQIQMKFLRDQIGVVLQESILFSGDIESNLKFGKGDASIEELDSACGDAFATEFIEQKDGGYKSHVEQRGKNFSGGQKQRLSIARTLLHQPKILILDDSTSALDMATESKLLKAMKSRMKGSTMFIVAQRLSAVMDADQIIVLEDGKISGMGTHKTLLETNKLYRNIAISQLGEEGIHHVTK